MEKYSVCFSVDATTIVKVEASSEEEAKEKAWREVCAPSVCCQCSREIEIGEVLEAIEVVEL